MSIEFPAETVYAYPLELSMSRSKIQGLLGEHFTQLKSEDSPWSFAPRAFYVHIPFCLTLCQFCGFVKEKVNKRSELSEYANLVVKEIYLLKKLIPEKHRRLDVIYFGGGTPSVLDPSDVGKILSAITSSFDISGLTEITFEGEANSLKEPDYLNKIAELGFNRLSFGIQTLDEGMREVLNLRPSLSTIQRVHEESTHLFEEVMIDFIYGWPGQTSEHAEQDFSRLCKVINPKSVELFMFEGLDASQPLLKQLAKMGATVPNTLERIRTRNVILDQLSKLNFISSSYTKFRNNDGDRSKILEKSARYDECYYGWDNGQVISAGRGAQTFLGGAMWGTAVSPSEYKQAINSNMLPATTFRRFDLGERESVTWPRRGYLNIPNNADISPKVNRLIQCGLAFRSNRTVRLTRLGEDYVPRIMDDLLPLSSKHVISKITAQRMN